MKKKTINTLTSIMGLILFAFSFIAFWYEKINSIMLIVMVAVAVGFVAFKNDKLEKLIDILMTWKK